MVLIRKHIPTANPIPLYAIIPLASEDEAKKAQSECQYVYSGAVWVRWNGETVRLLSGEFDQLIEGEFIGYTNISHDERDGYWTVKDEWIPLFE